MVFVYKMASQSRVIKFGYRNVVIQETVISAQCLFCKDNTVISEKIGTTSNFVCHLQRKHPAT